ncbi:Heterokaryon incompatibility [Fusarium austroafricanum]|uniref:Heterokaryon incompatibility n=1 Tax=Fusarium austroafricanum TaxID=2364996 RepID=A0A8H4KJN1_9HYPO|nr:Heterokaryon incompatibility [Fusarium austroafricanum]
MSDLESATEDGYVKWTQLPIETVTLPLDDPSTAAVLSWRWDTDEKNHTSRNILSSVSAAKRMGFRYLFMDIISIDQTLEANALLSRVVEFTSLYRTIPVIAAYDKIGTDFNLTVRRPWISNEIQAYRHNPTRIIYVSHNNQGGGKVEKEYSHLPEDIASFEFARMAERIWTTHFATTILMLLKGEISMESISDLKHIMPELAPVLELAYDKMSRNDFLMTAALLAQTGLNGTGVVNDSVTKANIHNGPELKEYDIYHFICTEARMKQENFEIYLCKDGYEEILVGEWIMRHNFYYDDAYYCRLRVREDAERAICTELGMSDAEFEAYTTRKISLQSALKQAETSDTVYPKIEVITVDLNESTGLE